MNRHLQNRINEYEKEHSRKKKWLGVAVSLCLAVAVGTSYILINPAATQEQKTYCGFEEHIEHTDECYEEIRTLICPLSEEGHVHSDSCYEEKSVLTCNTEETDGHQHSDECYEVQNTLVCTESECEPHHHEDGCYTTETVCVCGMEETDGHRHTDACYDLVPVLICENTEEDHEHTDECYEAQKTLVCTESECEPHHHEAGCYTEETVCVCGMEETDGHRHTDECYEEQKTLICTEPECEPHHHEAGCYTNETVCVCGMEEAEPHVHTDACYSIEKMLVCEHPLHTHTLQCFSNPDADVETASAWERTFELAHLIGNWNDDILSIAETQIGYKESDQNYQVQEDGTTIKGYTRYGDWYGDPYGDWSAMFCSFCMNYAGVDKDLMPTDADCQAWIDQLKAEDKNLFRSPAGYVPVPGDLVFFDLDEVDEEHPESRDADHMGIVTGLIYDSESKKIIGVNVIEGNSGNQVCTNSYGILYKNILGYGVLPQNPEWFTLEALTETGIQVTVGGLKSSIPCPAADITLSANEIISEESAALLASQLEADGAEDMDSILMDISLLYGEEIVEPVGPVYLSFAAKDVDVDSAVYHIDEENETVVEMSAEVHEFESTVVLETEHFSIFALTLRAKSGKNVTASVQADWDDTNNVLSSVILKTKSTAQICHNYDVYNGSSWTIGAGTWTAKVNANAEQTFDITALVNSGSLSTKYRARVAENTGTPENDKSGYSDEFSLYDILNAAKPGFSEWVSGAYSEFFGGERPTNAAQLFAAFDVYHDLCSLTLESSFDSNDILTVTAETDATFTPTYVWQYYDDANGGWVTLENEHASTLIATNYSELTPGAQPLLDGGKTVRCLLKNGDKVECVAVINNVNPLEKVYEQIIEDINTGLHLSTYTWYLNGAAKTADVRIGETPFMDYFYYDNVARDPDVPFSDGESYKNYLASEYRRIQKTKGEEAALEHVEKIWDQYIFDIFNPNPGAGVVGNYSYYPGPKGSGPISTYGDKIIEWPKDNASSFHNPYTGVQRNGEDGLINALAYDFLEGGVDYSRFIESLNKTATADAAGDYNENRTYDIDITAKTQATSVSPLAMLITVQTSWQMFDYPHANCVSGDGTYTTIEVGGAQHNTEMANLYDIKQAILRFVDWMDENFPGHNLVLGINEVQHGGSYNLINYNVGGNNKNANIIYVSNNSDLLHESIYNWDTFGNCEHVHYDTGAMEDAAKALEANLTGWVDVKGDPIQFDDINKVAVIIGGGTENTNGTNGYGCALPWGTFYSSDIDAVYGIRTNVGTPLNTDGVLSWLDYYKNNTGKPYSKNSDAGYSSGSATGNFTKKYVAPNEDAIFNYLVKIAQQELKSKGIKVQDESKSIDNVTVSDTVNDEFRIEENKPFVATVLDKNGNKVYETVITPTAYSAAGEITDAEATFTVYNSDGTVKSTVTPAVTVAQNGTETTLSIPVDIPYSYVPAGAEALPQSGTVAYTQKLSITRKSDKTTDVSYDFGTVYNTNDAKLHFEVIARDDYIGSNNVFTNKGLPEVSFKHVKLNREGNVYIDPNTGEQVIISDTVEGYDTPEVNVPIRFTADDGGSITVEVKTPVNLEDLSTTAGGTDPTLPGGYTGTGTDVADSEYITATVHDLIDNYDQINGTVSYTWVIPGGKEYPVPITLHVTDGDPDGDITAASEMAQQWTPKTAGTYDVVLKVTFTPDPVEDKGNFANDGGVTATRVTKLTQEGHETILVTAPEGGDTNNDTSITVTKVWSGEKGDSSNRPSSITFNIFQDGEFYDQKTVTSTDGWSYTFTGLPYSEPGSKPLHVYTYTVTEDRVSGYETTYETLQTVYHAPYWEEVPWNELDLKGETEYLIVQKDYKVAVNPDSGEKLVPVDYMRKLTDNEFLTPPNGLPADTESYFSDNNLHGWYIKYKSGGNEEQSHVKSAVEESKYLKRDGTLSASTAADFKLAADPKTNGKLKLNNKFLLISGNAVTESGDGTVFAYYAKYGNYWAEVPLFDIDVSGITEYVLVEKSSGKAVVPGTSAAEVTDISSSLMVRAEGAVEEYPSEIDNDAVTYISDYGYHGWHIKLTDGTSNANNYIEAAADDTTLYIKKDGSFSETTADDTRLVEITPEGKIKLNNKYLLIKADGTIGNDGDGSAFAFYKKVESMESPTYRSTVTNTKIPGGERENKTSVTVSKEWINNSDTTTQIHISLYQNGKLIDECNLNGTETTPWTHTFETYPGTNTKLPYFDTLTGEPYVYTVKEDVTSGFETGYTRTEVHDVNGGLHYLLYNETGGTTPGLYNDTAYILTADAAPTKDGTPVPYMFGYSGSTGTYHPASINTDRCVYGTLTGTKELTGTVDGEYVWTVERVAPPNDTSGTPTFYLRRNGYYVGVKDDGTVVFTGTPSGKKTSYEWKFNTESNKFFALVGNKNKYLKINLAYNDKAPKELKGITYATDGDANKATTFTVFEAISLQSGYDTYSYKVQNISTDESSHDGKVHYAKYIDDLADNIVDSETENPDTGLEGKYYRLYLDAIGVRDEGSENYPEFKGVYITDHLSKYVTIADNGSNLALTINKVSVNNPNDITYLWYGNLDMATGNIGKANEDGGSVIRSVVYTRAGEDETDSTGMIRVDFQPDYCLEEGYKYVVSYNVEASDYAYNTTDPQTNI